MQVCASSVCSTPVGLLYYVRRTDRFCSHINVARCSTIQALIILIFAPFASVVLTPLNVLATGVATFVTALAISSMGVVIFLRIHQKFSAFL